MLLGGRLRRQSRLRHLRRLPLKASLLALLRRLLLRLATYLLCLLRLGEHRVQPVQPRRRLVERAAARRPLLALPLGVVLGGIFLMPAITSLVASLFVDDVADHVEREHYPADHPGVALPVTLATVEGVKTALLTILVYVVALPFVLFAGVGFIIFFIATAWLLGREYFELAAMRFRSPDDAKAMRKENAATVFTAGLFIAAFVSIPIVNLATPLFGMAFMVHMYKRLSGPRRELMEPNRRQEISMR